MSNFILTDRQTDYLLPPSVDDWLNEDHLARFVVEVIDGLDLSNLTRQYAGHGSKAYAREKADYEQKMARRAATEQDTGKKPGGKPPQPPVAGARDEDQINLTDEESRIMPVAGGGFEQAYNAQAAVDAPTMLVVATGVTQAPNDKEQVEPMLATPRCQTSCRLGI